MDAARVRTCNLHTGGMRARFNPLPSNGSVTSSPGGTCCRGESGCQSHDATKDSDSCTVKAWTRAYATGAPDGDTSEPRTRNVPGGSARTWRDGARWAR